MWAEREGMFEDPFTHAMILVKDSNISTSRYINNLIANDYDDVGQSMNNLLPNVLTIENLTRILLFMTFILSKQRQMS